MRKPHVLFLTPGFARDESDTRCIPPLQDLAIELVKSGEVDLSIISIHYPDKKKEYSWNDIPVFPCGANNGSILIRPFAWRRAEQFYQSINQKNTIDLIHSFWFSETAWLANRIRRKFKVPHLNTLMGQEGINGNLYENRIDTSAMSLVSVSDFQRKKFEERSKIKVNEVVRWGVNYEQISQVEEHPKTIDLIGVGSLIPLKDYMTFVRIACDLLDKDPGLKIELIGGGQEFNALTEYAKTRGHATKVKFHGTLSRDETLERISQSKVLLHPSKYESFGMVFIEALALGAKIVSREVGIAVKEENWVIARNEAEMKKGVLDMLKMMSFNRVQNFSIKRTAENYLSLYMKAIDKH